MFVAIAKSSAAMGASASEPKAGGAAVGKGGGKERKEPAAAAVGTDEETANALALNLYISDTADAVIKLVDVCVKAGELVHRSEGGKCCTDDSAGRGPSEEIRDRGKRNREGRAAVGDRGKGAGSRGASNGKEACDDMSDKLQWTNADDEAYKRELGRERFKTIPLLEMVEEGTATFALDVNGPQFTAPPKPIWSGSSLPGSSLANLLSQMSAHGAGPSGGWMVVGPGGIPSLPPGLAQVVGSSGAAGASDSGKGASAGAAGGGGSGSGGKAAAQTVRGRMTRIASEVTSLSTNLPVEAGSSIFVRVDEDRPDVIKALIVGPEDTPYENGMFEFDILLPLTYPQSPPQVKLVTTGLGRVRFNPNLYAGTFTMCMRVTLGRRLFSPVCDVA